MHLSQNKYRYRCVYKDSGEVASAVSMKDDVGYRQTKALALYLSRAKDREIQIQKQELGLESTAGWVNMESIYRRGQLVGKNVY